MHSNNPEQVLDHRDHTIPSSKKCERVDFFCNGKKFHKLKKVKNPTNRVIS